MDLYKRYGYFREETISLTLSGIEGIAKINDIMTYFRKNDISKINNNKVIDVKAYLKRIDSLPKANVLKYLLEDGFWIAIRSSGTEPKLKFYIATKGQYDLDACDKIDEIKNALNEIIDMLV